MRREFGRTRKLKPEEKVVDKDKSKVDLERNK